MTEAQARLRLESMVAHDVEPALAFGDIEDLLQLAKREDSEGRAPDDDDWEPTFDLVAAAAEGWRRKAGRVVPRFGVSVDGDTLQRQQIYAHCIAQADLYARQVLGTISVTR